MPFYAVIFIGLIWGAILILPGYVVVHTFISLNRILFKKDQKEFYIWDLKKIITSSLFIIHCFATLSFFYLVQSIDVNEHPLILFCPWIFPLAVCIYYIYVRINNSNNIRKLKKNLKFNDLEFNNKQYELLRRFILSTLFSSFFINVIIIGMWGLQGLTGAID